MDTISKPLFATCDIFLCVCLLSLNFEIEAIDRSNKQKVQFYFEKSNELDGAIEAYWRRELRIEPQLFSSNLKSIKNRIYSS